eukprot:4927194-Pyramimonas_sp.AAC.1
MSIGSEKARNQSTLIFLRFWKDFGLFWASWWGSLATWSRLGAVLGPLACTAYALAGHSAFPSAPPLVFLLCGCCCCA